MLLYRNTKEKVCLLHGNTDYFDILAGVLQGDKFASHLFIICRDYVLRTSIDKMKNNGFKLTEERSRRYPAQKLRTRTTLLHSLQRADPGIGLHADAHKTEYMFFNQTGDISTLNGNPLKLVDKFTYLGSIISSIETVIKRDYQRHWQLLIGYRSYGSQTWPIK